MACEFCPEGDGWWLLMTGRLRVPAALQRWSAMGYDFKFVVRFFTFFDVSSISIDCPARCKEVHIKSRLFIRPAHTQALMSAAESRHRHRNPPSAAVPCRQPIRCQPSDLVPCCRAPSRHRHSPPRQRPILVARLRSLPQPFVPCRRVVAEGRSHPSANLAFPLLPSFCRQNFVIFTSIAFRGLSAATMWASLYPVGCIFV